MRYQKSIDIDFSSRMMGAVYLSVLAGAVMKGLYVFVFLPNGYVTNHALITLSLVSLAVVTAMVETFVVMPLFIKKKVNVVCKEIIQSVNDPSYTADSRTHLVEVINKLSGKVSRRVALVNVIAIILFFVLFAMITRLPRINLSFSLVAFLCTSAVTWLLVIDSMTSVCSKAAKVVTEKPLNVEAVKQNRSFGKNTYISLWFHLGVPLLFLLTCALLLIVFQKSTDQLNYLQAAVVVAMHFAVLWLLLHHYKLQTITEINRVNDTLTAIMESTDDVRLPYDLDYDLSYTVFLINRVITRLLTNSDITEKNAAQVLEWTKNLGENVESSSFSVNSQSDLIQSAVNGISKITDYQNTLDNEFSDVSLNTKNTLNSINSGAAVLAESLEKISLITSANIETISGIKELSEQIEQIWAVISTIESITEKTRTIAFNAEIETSGMGDSGENFHIVANEIRRLADSITDSTLAIRKKITTIQHASDNLIITSEGGTEKIREESELFTRLEEKFQELKLSGQVTEESADHIRNFMMNEAQTFKELYDQIQELNDNFMGLSNSADEMLTARSMIESAFAGVNNE